MIIEHWENNETLIKLSSSLNSFNFRRLVDHIKCLEIISKSKAKQKNIDALANSVSANWWKENKKRFI